MSPLTKAMYARYVGQMAVRLARESADLAEGMWNPAFCSSRAAWEARSLCRELRETIEHLETLAAPPSEGSQADARSEATLQTQNRDEP